jgi:transposase InsO family protein
MTANQAVYPVQLMARVMGVSRSGFYAWQRRAPSNRTVADAALSARIAEIHNASKQTYGAPRIHAELADEGVSVGRKRIERLMKAAALVGVSRRKGTRTTIRDERVRPANDLVDQLPGRRAEPALGGGHYMSRPGRASSTCPSCSMPSRGGSSVGRWGTISRRSSSSTR